MALLWTNSAISSGPQCSGLKVKQYTNAHLSYGFKTTKAVKVKALQNPQTKDVKIKSQEMELGNFQPCLVRREALVGIGALFFTIFSIPTESAEARTRKADWKKKMIEKYDELREKMGLKKNDKDEKLSETSKEPLQKAQKVEIGGPVVEVDFSR